MDKHDFGEHNDYADHGEKAALRRLPCSLIMGRFLVFLVAIAVLVVLGYYNLLGLG